MTEVSMTEVSMKEVSMKEVSMTEVSNMSTIPSHTPSNFFKEISFNPMTYFDSNFWIENSDEYIAQLPGMSIGFPINWLVTVIVLLYFIRIWGPKWMDKRPHFDTKPWCICIDGFVVGGYVTAISTGAWITNLYLDCFDCHAYKVTIDDISTLGVKHLAYSAVYAKLFDFIIPIIVVLSKKPDVSNWHLAQLSFSLLGAVILAKLNPGGIFIFVTVLDGIYCITLYCYLTFAAAGGDMKPGLRSKSIVYFTRMVTMALTMAHAAYFLSIPDCGSTVLKFGMTLYSALCLIIFPYDWYKTEKERKLAFKRKFSLIQPSVVGTFTFNPRF